MKELKETKTSAMLPTADATHPATAAATQEVYVKPQIEVIELELEQPVLQGSGAGGSDFGNGGRY